MKLKMIIPMLLGFMFAIFILPRFANMTLAAKYKRAGTAYASEKGDDSVMTSCTITDTNASSIGEAVQKMKCRSRPE